MKKAARDAEIKEKAARKREQVQVKKIEKRKGIKRKIESESLFIKVKLTKGKSLAKLNSKEKKLGVVLGISEKKILKVKISYHGMNRNLSDTLQPLIASVKNCISEADTGGDDSDNTVNYDDESESDDCDTVPWRNNSKTTPRDKSSGKISKKTKDTKFGNSERSIRSASTPKPKVPTIFEEDTKFQFARIENGSQHVEKATPSRSKGPINSEESRKIKEESQARILARAKARSKGTSDVQVTQVTSIGNSDYDKSFKKKDDKSKEVSKPTIPKKKKSSDAPANPANLISSSMKTMAAAQSQSKMFVRSGRISTSTNSRLSASNFSAENGLHVNRPDKYSSVEERFDSSQRSKQGPSSRPKSPVSSSRSGAGQQTKQQFDEKPPNLTSPKILNSVRQVEHFDQLKKEKVLRGISKVFDKFEKLESTKLQKKGTGMDWFASYSNKEDDFFELDSRGLPIIDPIVPIFPEDFEPGQKNWDLSWWGVFEPPKELLAAAGAPSNKLMLHSQATSDVHQPERQHNLTGQQEQADLQSRHSERNR